MSPAELDTFVINQARCIAEIRAHHSVNPVWPATETINGPGSTMRYTENVREWLPKIVRDYGIASMLDAPCGDLTWLSCIDLGGIDYLGYDIDSDALDVARSRAPDGYKFRKTNLLTKAEIPKADLVLVRDLIIHLPNEAISLLLAKLRASGSTYLATTWCPSADNQDDCPLDGGKQWSGYFDRAINLEVAPFNLAPNITACPDTLDMDPWRDKHLALYRL